MVLHVPVPVFRSVSPAACTKKTAMQGAGGSFDQLRCRGCQAIITAQKEPLTFARRATCFQIGFILAVRLIMGAF
jgi:hypothetical protein